MREAQGGGALRAESLDREGEQEPMKKKRWEKVVAGTIPPAEKEKATCKVITVTSGKGGVGKTTVTANLASAMAMSGKKVCAIDCDIGLRNLDIVMGLENRIVYDIVDIVEGRARLKQAMIKDKRHPTLHLIPAAQTRDKSAVTPKDMVMVCDQLREEMDFIFLDCPAGIENGFKNAIAPSDQVLIVVNPEVSSVRDADRIIGLIEAEEKGPGYLIINRMKHEMVERGEMLSQADILDILAVELLGIIPEDENIVVSSNRGNPIAMEEDNGSFSRQAFHHITRRLCGEEVPFLDLARKPGIMARFKTWVGARAS